MFRTIIIACVLTTALSFSVRNTNSRFALRMSDSEAPVAETTPVEASSEEGAPAAETPAPTPAAPAAPVKPAAPVFDFKSQPGVSGPFGFFDPMGLCPPDEKNFKKYRESELKHGRIAMLAFLGIVIGESAGFLFGDKINAPAIYQFQQAQDVVPAFVQNVIGFILAIEGFNIVKGWEPIPVTMESSVGIAGLTKDYENGDLGFDPLGFKPDTDAAYKSIQTKELNNGRLAMLGVAGIVAQELVTNAKIF